MSTDGSHGCPLRVQRPVDLPLDRSAEPRSLLRLEPISKAGGAVIVVFDTGIWVSAMESASPRISSPCDRTEEEAVRSPQVTGIGRDPKHEPAVECAERRNARVHYRRGPRSPVARFPPYVQAVSVLTPEAFRARVAIASMRPYPPVPPGSMPTRTSRPAAASPPARDPHHRAPHYAPLTPNDISALFIPTNPTPSNSPSLQSLTPNPTCSLFFHSSAHPFPCNRKRNTQP